MKTNRVVRDDIIGCGGYWVEFPPFKNMEHKPSETHKTCYPIEPIDLGGGKHIRQNPLPPSTTKTTIPTENSYYGFKYYF